MTVTRSYRNTFLEDGFVFLPSVLDSRTVDLALRCWQWSIDNAGPSAARVLPDSLSFTDDLSTARTVPTDSDGFFYQDVSNPASGPIYEPLLSSPSLINVLTSLFDGGPAWYIGEQVFLKEGNSPDTGWHQDTGDFMARGDELIALWIPLDTLDADTSLGMVRGSHKGPVYSSIYGRYKADPIPDVDARPDEFEVVSFACEPGDVVAFHMNCLHGRAKTHAGQRRRSVALRFFGEETFYDTRVNPSDPRNGKPYSRDQRRQVLPVPTPTG